MNTRLTALLACAALTVFSLACEDDHGHDHDHEDGDHAHAEAPEDHLPPIPEGARTFDVTVTDVGYKPHTFEGAPGETIVLNVTRKSEATCGEYLVVQGTKTRAQLPLNKAVKVPVTLPEEGKVVFACGMDMMHGILKVVPGAEGEAPAAGEAAAPEGEAAPEAKVEEKAEAAPEAAPHEDDHAGHTH